MADRTEAPTGFARRSRRLSDGETEQRMLHAAVAMVHRTGLTVGLDHLSFEDIIRDADVSRSAAYRRWPYKDLFLSDLVTELAQDGTPELVTDEIALLRQVLAEHPDWLETAELRESLLQELFRRLALLDFEAMYSSAGWRTYLALHATVMSLAEGELRDRVRARLAESERARTARVARAWEQLATLFGYRIRPELGSTFEAVSTLLSATLHGLIIMALAAPEIGSYRARARPLGAAETSEWSLVALSVSGIARMFLEPDTSVVWDHDRSTRVRRALEVWTPPGTQPVPGRPKDAPR